jgi:hypothetical protein
MDAIARRSMADRLEEWAALNRAGADMEAEAVRRRHPDYSDHQVFLALVRRRYGDELAGAAWPASLSVEP